MSTPAPRLSRCRLAGSTASSFSVLALTAVVITCAKRTPLCKARRGAYKDTTYDELLLATMVAAKNSIGIDTSLVGDICVGTVTTPNAPNTARLASLAAGFRE